MESCTASNFMGLCFGSTASVVGIQVAVKAAVSMLSMLRQESLSYICATTNLS
jgi:hypothetical protein